MGRPRKLNTAADPFREEIPPPPVTVKSAQEIYDDIYTAMLAQDVVVRRFNREIDACEKRIRYQIHLRHVASVGLRAHTKLIKRYAEAALRDKLGVRSIPGFKPQSETNSQFLTRMKRKLREIEQQAEEDAQRETAG